MQAHQAHCSPYESESTSMSPVPDNESTSIRTSDDIRKGLLLHPYENYANTGMRCQQPVRRLLSMVSREKERKTDALPSG